MQAGSAPLGLNNPEGVGAGYSTATATSSGTTPGGGGATSVSVTCAARARQSKAALPGSANRVISTEYTKREPTGTAAEWWPGGRRSEGVCVTRKPGLGSCAEQLNGRSTSRVAICGCLPHTEHVLMKAW